MSEPAIDLRSDTVTRPTGGMRDAIGAAQVGDDVFHEDPTVNLLEERVAHLLGKDAAVFVPSGTMSNQIGIRIHTQPGDELLCDVNCHIYNYEAGGPAVLSGVTCQTLNGNYGILELGHVLGKVRPINDHTVRTRLLCLENTHNRGGGRIYPLETILSLCQWARKHGLATHLDGARLWNAIAATKIPASTWAAEFDTVSVCFSKGLGAPVGSALAGPRDLITQARRFRKLLGGGMRQAGVLAAAVHYALDNHIDRLTEDHVHAQKLASAIRETPGLRLTPPVVESNLIWFEVEPLEPQMDSEAGLAREVALVLKENGVLVHVSGPRTLRACTHLDVSREQIDRASEIIRTVVPRVTQQPSIVQGN